ncbi:MAG: hypothetical protein KDA29_03520 [Phycisphaerales bacterium]|nr:hypothetical protein [Phycisphaerales bacterium]
MTHHNDTTQTHQRSGWLWVSAGVLASLILVQGAGMLDSTAHAEMSSTSGAYTMITTDGGNDEILIVVDSSQEMLMVYRGDRNQGMQLLDREELSGLFARARARALGQP